MPRYSRVLLEHATDPRNGGLLAAANASGRASLADRGPELRLHLVVEHETVVRASFQTFGCGVAVACGSMLTELIQGRTIADCRALGADQLVDHLDGLPPDKRFCADVAVQALAAALDHWERQHGPNQKDAEAKDQAAP